MGQIDTRSFHKIIGVVEHFVITRFSVVVRSVTDVDELRVIKGIATVREAIAVLVNTTTTIFVVVVPLGDDKASVVVLTLLEVHLHGDVIRRIIESR